METDIRTILGPAARPLDDTEMAFAALGDSASNSEYQPEQSRNPGTEIL